MTTTIPHFQEELEQLKARLLEMGGLAEDRVRSAIRALVERDPELVEQVLGGDQPINQLHIEIDSRCFKLLALHQPMAVDLRAIVSGVKINTDLERVGDLAINIAEAGAPLSAPRAGQGADRHPADGRHRPGDAARRAGFVRQARHRARPAGPERRRRPGRAEDAGLPRAADLHARRIPHTIEPSLDLILVSRHLERIGDHATNIAEDVIFMVSARDVRHHAEEI